MKGLTTVCAALTVCGLTAAASAQVTPGTTRIVVMPFETTDRDPHSLWLGEAAAVLIGDTLRAVGLPALTRAERVSAFSEVNLPSDATLSYASLIRVGQIVAASDIIVGTFRVSGGEIVLDARRIRLDTGRVQEQTTDRAPLRDLFVLHDRVARRLMGVKTAPAAAPADSPPLEVFELFVKGLIAEQTETRIRFLQQALAAHPRYDRAQLGLWDAYTEQGDHARALAAAQAVAPTSRLSRRARFDAGLSLVELRRLDDAYHGVQGSDGRAARRPRFYNNLGRRPGAPRRGAAVGPRDVLLQQGVRGRRRGARLLFQPRLRLLARSRRARRLSTGCARRFAATRPMAMRTSCSAPRCRRWGSPAEAARERELARQLSSKYAEWEKRRRGRPTPCHAVSSGWRRTSSASMARGSTSRRSVRRSASRRQLAAFHLERGRRLFDQEQNREALAELRKAVYLAPYDAEPHLLIGRLYLRTGRPREAIDALRVALWSKESAAGRADARRSAAGGGRRGGRPRRGARALELEPANAEAKALLARLDKR